MGGIIGRFFYSFGMTVTAAVLLSMLARNFSVEPTVDTASVKELLNFTMMPSVMPVRLKPLVH